MKKELKPFKLFPPVPFIESFGDSKGLENYLNIILHDLKEEGGKSNFLRKIIMQPNDYRKCGKIDYIKNLFRKGKIFESIEGLKEELKKGGLEKTAYSIEMQPLNTYGVGKIKYKACNQNEGDFALYIFKI